MEAKMKRNWLAAFLGICVILFTGLLALGAKTNGYARAAENTQQIDYAKPDGLRDVRENGDNSLNNRDSIDRNAEQTAGKKAAGNMALYDSDQKNLNN